MLNFQNFSSPETMSTSMTPNTPPSGSGMPRMNDPHKIASQAATGRTMSVPVSEPGAAVRPQAPLHPHARSAGDLERSSLTALLGRESAIIRCSRMLANSTSFTVFTGVLTLYALFGDDVRLSSTRGDADPIFNWITVMALSAFTIEIVTCCLGKEGYFLGFFFWLDAVTTISLVMDITVVAQEIEEMLSGEDDGNQNVTRASRASRVGSKAGRVVRVIRLIRLLRIVKLYKHAVEARHAKLRKARAALRVKVHPDTEDGEDDSDEEHMDGEFDQGNGSGEPETRVGKKLSELTTMRVIVLVLVMLFVVPHLTFPQFKDEFSSSSQYGADVVFRNWKRWWDSAESEVSDAAKLGNSPSARPTVVHSRQSYEKSLLLYAFYHNWGKTMGECTPDRVCPANYHMPLIWIGYRPPKSGNVLLGPELRTVKYDCLNATNIASINANFNSDDWLYEMGTFPPDVLRGFSEPWVESCNCGSEECNGVNIMSHGIEGGADDYPCPGNRKGGDKSGLRFQETAHFTSISASTLDRDKYGQFIFYFDQRTKVAIEALLNIMQTLFVVFVLALGALFFSKDANTLVLAPIERMIAKMEKIRDNPLAAMKLGDEEYRREEQQRKAREAGILPIQTGPKWKFWAKSNTPTKEPMETAILEKTIIKIGGLLALGFGEAGANIIGQNMKGSDSATVDAMVPGRKVDAIFGFCGIRNFTDATEILQDKVMLFVNQIGEIVHGVVDEYNGVPNKNIGDAFLLVWQLPASEAERPRIADLAILSYCRIVLGVNQSPVLAEYRGHPGLLQRLPHYRVQLAFGFHYGWAIEGAIGSEFKIDASYLSPNVNMASRLEAATRQFGIFMLMSHLLHDLCSLPVCRRCRAVDRVMVKGSNIDIGLYTLDLDISITKVQQPTASRFVKNRYKVRQIREQMKLAKLTNTYSVEDFFDDANQEIAAMRNIYTPEFLKKFNMAYRNYEAGEWAVCKDMFENAQTMLETEDGPSTTLLAYMKEFNYIAPPTWAGFRELAEKR
eukprot:GEMP01003350.1.p1 GENE.GEMP01003350.1~~GEMP01003350.1.p1  ORF type:complete len:1014 (+),score=182.63 GEMP01003350.1:101-3142(+)